MWRFFFFSFFGVGHSLSMCLGWAEEVEELLIFFLFFLLDESCHFGKCEMLWYCSLAFPGLDTQLKITQYSHF